MLSNFSLSDFLQPYGPWSAMLFCPWDSQARILEWVSMLSSRISSRPRMEAASPGTPALEADIFTIDPLEKPSNNVN